MIQAEKVFPEDMLQLGHHLWHSIDVGSAMMAKVLTQNGQVLHKSTFIPFTSDDLVDKEGQDACYQFVIRVYNRLGSWVLPRDLEDKGLENTPQYDPYKDETQYKQTFLHLQEELELMPEITDQYLGSEISLPREDQMARGR